jgi:hypothetical protein
MGLLSFFSKPARPLLKLHSGSFTMDRSGEVIVSTVPTSFPAELIRDIGRTVLDAFRDAHDSHLPLNELVVHYPSLRITAREMRGGAIVFLAPIVSTSSPKVLIPSVNKQTNEP